MLVDKLAEVTVGDLEYVGDIRLLLNVECDVGTVEWAKEHANIVDRLLEQNGALLIRGLKVSGSKQLSKVLSIFFGGELSPYIYRSTPRTLLREHVYTATEYHPAEFIPQHNENSYSNGWPMKIGFYCQTPAVMGGETPIADSRLIYKNIPDEIRQKFTSKKIKYVRNYSDIDLPWSEVFQTNDRKIVEQFCNENSIDWEWVGENNLKTSQINNAVEIHPLTGEMVWFNQAHLFHVSNLDPVVKNSLLSVFGEENLPRNSFYGDGSKIDENDLAVIRSVYKKHEIPISWRKDDLLLLDNMRFSHGRRPYAGERKVLTGMR